MKKRPTAEERWEALVTEFRHRHGVYDTSVFPGSAQCRDVWMATEAGTGERLLARTHVTLGGHAADGLSRTLLDRAAARAIGEAYGRGVPFPMKGEVEVRFLLTLHREEGQGTEAQPWRLVASTDPAQEYVFKAKWAVEPKVALPEWVNHPPGGEL